MDQPVSIKYIVFFQKSFYVLTPREWMSVCDLAVKNDGKFSMPDFIYPEATIPPIIQVIDGEFVSKVNTRVLVTIDLLSVEDFEFYKTMLEKRLPRKNLSDQFWVFKSAGYEVNLGLIDLKATFNDISDAQNFVLQDKKLEWASIFDSKNNLQTNYHGSGEVSKAINPMINQ